MINDSNCRNCGAPVEPGKICEYCGTPRPIPVKSAIRMTADSITLECDTLKIGEAVSKQNAHSIEYGRIGN